jgi:hypothetical protein
MQTLDKYECSEAGILRLKAERHRLRLHKRKIKAGATVMTPELRAELDALDNRIRVVCDLIFHITGDRQ